MTKYRQIDSLSSQSINKDNIYLDSECSYDTKSNIIKHEKVYDSGCTLQQVMTDDELIKHLFPESIVFYHQIFFH